MSLLDIAKEHKLVWKSGKAKEITSEHIELALAWAKDEVTLTQVEVALYGKVGGMNSYVDLARSLREAIRLGIVVEKTK